MIGNAHKIGYQMIKNKFLIFQNEAVQRRAELKAHVDTKYTYIIILGSNDTSGAKSGGGG